jgi:WD40 repeat protein
MKNLFAVLILSVLSFAGLAQTNGIVVPIGHLGMVERLVVDNQQKFIYGLERNRAVMWDFKTGLQFYTFDLQGSGDVLEFSISNDGSKILVVSTNYTVVFSTIDGKELYRNRGGESGMFSEDGKRIYLSGRYFFRQGYLEVDLTTKLETQHLVCPNGDLNCPIAINVQKLNETEWLVFVNRGWRIYDLSKKQETLKIELAIPNEKSNGDVIYRNYKVLPAQNLVLMYGEYQVNVYSLRDGKLLKILPISNQDFTVINSTDASEFGITHANRDNNEIKIYNAKTFEVKKTINPDGLNLVSALDERFITYTTCPTILANKNQLLLAQRTDLKLLDLKTNKVLKTYKRELTEYGLDFEAGRDYNFRRQRLNFFSHDSIFRSIDMKRLVPLVNKNIGYMIGYPEVSISNTGDTVGVFPLQGNGVLRNVNTRKKTPLLFGQRDKEGANTPMPDFFFSKDGIHGYVYTTVLARYDRFTITLHRVNLKTGVRDQPVIYGGDVEYHEVFLDVDKEIISVFTETKTVYTIKTWNLRSGKLVINKSYPLSAWDKMETPKVILSSDGKKIAYMLSQKTEFYALPSGAPLYSTPMKRIFGNNKTTVANRSMSQFVTLYDNGSINSRDSTGKINFEIKAHKDYLRAVYFSDDDKILYTISDDATIKAWNAGNGELYGTLYVFRDGNDYVFLDRYGRFDGTPEGIKKLYFLSGRSVIPLDVVYERFYTPNLYVRLINGEVFEPIEIKIKPLPQVKVNYASAQRNLDVVEDDVPSYQNTTGFADITVKAIAPEDAVDEIRLFHNGKIVTLTTRNLIVTDDKSESSSKTYQLSLLPGVNNIRAVALNTQRTESQPDEIMVNFSSGAANANVVKPVVNGKTVVDVIDKNATVHLIVVGINQYKNPKMSLNYALADATAFKTEAEKGAKTFITNVKTYFVTDAAADRSGIEQAFKDVQKTAKPEDVLMFYYAGHGVISEKNKEFYLVPTDVTDLKNVDEALAQHGIPSRLLQQYAIDIAAQKQVFILDACQSAGAFETLLKGDGDQQKSLAVVARSTGTHWIAASGSQQFANEFSDLGHGAFTYVLLKAMGGGAKNNNMITVNGLKNFLQVQVPELMKKYNGTPQYPSSYGLGNDFPVEVMK